MLAAHRDQENLVHGHPVPAKPQPKTPGARYPKTPLGLRNDENAPTGFVGKAAIDKPGENDRLMAKGTVKRQAMVTPMEARTRAPLGNKTTNAKARAGRSVGVKDMVKEIEMSRSKQNTLQQSKPKPKPVALEPAKLAIQADIGSGSDDDEEPEYAPPRPTPLPYQSDVLPEGGLTFEGLKRGNLLKGFYQHFHNPVDDKGVSREERRFKEEMHTVLARARERNDKEAAGLDWSTEDMAETVDAIRRKAAWNKGAEPLDKAVKRGAEKHAANSCSRRAASALATAPGQTAVARPPWSSTSARRPLSALIPGRKAHKLAAGTPSASGTGNTAGEAASRTTIGYNKGRTASSMVRSRGPANGPKQSGTPPGGRDADAARTVTAARVDEAGLGRESLSVCQAAGRPQFLCIFDVDDEDLPAMGGPCLGSDEDEEDFELKLSI